MLPMVTLQSWESEAASPFRERQRAGALFVAFAGAAVRVEMDVGSVVEPGSGGEMQGRSVLSSLMGRRGFPPAKMSESIGDNPNRRLSHAGIAAGGFAHHPRPSSRRRQAVRSG